jgi:hypothetical protein
MNFFLMIYYCFRYLQQPVGVTLQKIRFVSKLNHKNTPKKIDISKKGVNYSPGIHRRDSPGRHLGGHPVGHPMGHPHTPFWTHRRTPREFLTWHPQGHPGRNPRGHSSGQYVDTLRRTPIGKIGENRKNTVLKRHLKMWLFRVKAFCSCLL